MPTFAFFFCMYPSSTFQADYTVLSLSLSPFLLFLTVVLCFTYSFFFLSYDHCEPVHKTTLLYLFLSKITLFFCSFQKSLFSFCFFQKSLFFVYVCVSPRTTVPVNHSYLCLSIIFELTFGLRKHGVQASRNYI